MPTFSDPVADANEAMEAIRGLAHATRSIENPSSIYPVLRSISTTLASLTQTLHQLGHLHDGPAIRSAWLNGDSRVDCASSYRVSWELHRAAEMAHQVAAAVDRAHQIEATIAYNTPDRPLRDIVAGPLAGASGAVNDGGMSL